MKKTRKIISILLIAVMMMAMSVTAFATNSSNNGSITISEDTVGVGETYSVYKMLDLTYSAGQTSYSYVLDSGSEWYGFFTGTGAGAAYVSVDATTGVVTWTAGTTGTESLAKALATAALEYATANSISPTASITATDTTVKFSNLEYGYYLIDSSLGTVLTLDSTDPSVTVDDKNTSPTVEKTVMEDSSENYGSSNTADIGETVNFRLEITDAYSASNLVVNDTLANGLTLNTDSFTVKVGSSLASADSTVDSQYYKITTTGLTDGCTFEISFTDTFTSTILTSSQVIVIEYTATVNSNAVINSTGNTNETYLSYGNASKSTPSKTTTYVYELYVYKYTTDTSSGEVALEDASFVLYKSVIGTKYYVVLDSSGKVSSWTTYKTQDDIDNAVKAGTITQEEADALSCATVLTTGSTGLVYIGGLDAGSYYLEETEAPTGYNLLAAAVDVEIAQDGTIKGADTVTVGSDTYTAIKIYNGSTSEMPSTGGIGTTIFYVIGAILVVGACVILITRRRMGRAE